MVGIYKITSPSGKIYIGQSVNIERRKSEYKSYCHKGKLNNSIKKHGFENHTFEILEECEIEKLNERERHFQDFYDVLGPNGLNLKLTETSDKSAVISQETKDKLSIIGRGKTISQEHRQRISIAFTGRKVSEETRKKMSISRNKVTNSEAHKNRVVSEETRKRCLKEERVRFKLKNIRRKILKVKGGGTS